MPVPSRNLFTMTSTASTLLIPGEDASWRVWKPRASAPSEAVGTPADYGDKSKPIIVGLPATACRSVGLVLPQADHNVLGEMVEAQLERRGIKGANGEPPVYRWHMLGHAGPNAIVSVDALAEPFQEELAVAHASNYAASLRLAQLPAGQLVITEEQGDLVIAANHQGKLYHSHVFAQRPADAGVLAQEILLTRLGLETQPALGGVTGVTLVGSWDADVVADLRRVAGMPVQVVDSLSPGVNLDTRTWTELLPRSITSARAAVKTRNRYIRTGLLIAFAYAAAFVGAFVYLSGREKIATELSAAVEKISEPAAAVKRTSERWKALSPALDPRRYPMVIMSQITALMPPSGIAVRNLRVKLEEVEMKGDARDLTAANQFLEDLKKHKELSRFNWTMPQPSVRDKTVTWRIQGKQTL
ncbi:MAG: hypothetical protein JWO89_3054 [Verrucomicrobiaceae bacterium]|nr:hypothetical protein [Verrucomicrobiaceae bacterium]